MISKKMPTSHASAALIRANRRPNGARLTAIVGIPALAGGIDVSPTSQ